MKIALGADSAGKPLLDVIAAHLARRPELTVADLSEPRLRRDVRQGTQAVLARAGAVKRHPVCRRAAIGLGHPPTKGTRGAFTRRLLG